MNSVDLSKPNNFSLEDIISHAISLPGVKVNKDSFLKDTFSKTPYSAHLEDIILIGPIKASVKRKDLYKLAKNLIAKRTSASSIASFLAGLPGGPAIAATIPADILQYFAFALRLAQELSYLYGANDLWIDGNLDDSRVKNQLILYLGVMFGASGASQGVRVLSSQLAKTTLKKLPQKALTKTFWYPIVKQIGKAIGIKITKTTVAAGISKVIPIVGGLLSGGINFGTMYPMANRLLNTLDKASFDYSENELEKDITVIEILNKKYEPSDNNNHSSSNSIQENTIRTSTLKKPSNDELISKIEDLFELRQKGALTEEEFKDKKAELLNKFH